MVAKLYLWGLLKRLFLQRIQKLEGISLEKIVSFVDISSTVNQQNLSPFSEQRKITKKY